MRHTMKLFPRISCMAALALAATPLLMTGCQQQKPSLMFLTENVGTEEGARFIVRYNGRYYTRQPMLHLENFEKFRSFLNNDGSYGVVLTVKKEYRTRLFTATATNEGRLMLPVFNGLAFEPLRISRPVEHGHLVIWGGLNGYDLKQLSKALKPEDETMEEKRYKDENPRPLPKKPKNPNQQRDLHGRTIPELYSAQQS